MNVPDKEQSFLLMDEFPTIKIPNFNTIPETARSNKVSVNIFMQDLSQLVASYGIDVSQSILSTLANQFLLRTTNPKTIDHFQKLFTSLGTDRFKW